MVRNCQVARMDAQERFGDILDQLRADCEERVVLVEELAGKAAGLQDQVHKLEEEKTDRESSVRRLQQELADSLKKLSTSEASLEVNTRYRNDLEDEKTRLLNYLDRLKEQVREGEDQYVQAERQINAMKSSLDDKDRELCTTARRLQEALSASAATDATTKQLGEAVQRLETENARLEAAAKQQSTLSHTAQDSQALWEEELKSCSKLGLRLAELEKEKGELGARREDVWREVHGAVAHAGVKGILAQLRRRFFWSGMEGAVRQYQHCCVAGFPDGAGWSKTFRPGQPGTAPGSLSG